ncbi:DUF3717 domain-containing protein [Burkholderia sp. MR1-5-21]
MSTNSNDPEADSVSLARLETAINAWREIELPVAPDEDFVLGRESACLAEVYGAMIYHGWSSLPLATLRPDQRDALLAAEA